MLMADEKENQLPKNISEQIGKAAERTVTLERASIKVNEEDRTVELCFSTENPVERWGGYEILDHSPGAADLRRLNKGGPVLLCHVRTMQTGAVVKGTARIDEDRKARATIKFSRSTLGQETMQDVADEIRTSVSVRYIPRKMILEKQDKEKGNTYRVTKWEALEISFEPIEADITCGVGRSAEEESQSLEALKRQAETLGVEIVEKPSDAPERTDDNQPTTETRKAMADEKKDEKPQVSEEVLRAREVVEMGEVLEEKDLARTMAAEGKTVVEFRAAVVEKRKTEQQRNNPPAEDPAATGQRNGGGQQLARVISRYGKLRNFKGEGAEGRAYRFGQWFLAGPMGRKRAQDFCREHGIELRAQVESENEKGGFLVPHEFGNDMIDLREQFGVFRRNAKIVPMISDSRSDPRRTGGLEGYWVDEGDEPPESEKGWDRVGLRAKKLMVLARLSSEISEDSAINTGDDLAGEIAYTMAKKEDQAGFNGDGTSGYGGIVGVRTKLKGLSGTIANIAGLQVGTGNLYSELLLNDFAGVVARLPEYADTPTAKWFVHRSFFYNVMVKLLLAAGGITAADIEAQRVKRFLGYEVEFAQAMPKKEANSQVCALLGDLSKGARVGSRRETTIALSEHSRFRTDEIEIRGTERVDITVHDVGNANSDADLQEAGPIVGLITAAS